MNDILNFLLGLAVLIFLAYVLIFGGVGALLARHRGGSAATGFIIGLVPVIGWFVVLFITRSGTRAIGADEWLEERALLRRTDPPPTETPLGSPVRPSASDPHDY